jgi:hypothetical protein
LLTETAQILGRWSQYCEDFYKENRTEPTEESTLLSSRLNMEPIPLVEETMQAVESIHANKACGPDQIPIELIQQGGEAVIGPVVHCTN